MSTQQQRKAEYNELHKLLKTLAIFLDDKYHGAEPLSNIIQAEIWQFPVFTEDANSNVEEICGPLQLKFIERIRGAIDILSGYFQKGSSDSDNSMSALLHQIIVAAFRAPELLLKRERQFFIEAVEKDVKHYNNGNNKAKYQQQVIEQIALLQTIKDKLQPYPAASSPWLTIDLQDKTLWTFPEYHAETLKKSYVKSEELIKAYDIAQNSILQQLEQDNKKLRKLTQGEINNEEVANLIPAGLEVLQKRYRELVSDMGIGLTKAKNLTQKTPEIIQAEEAEQAKEANQLAQYKRQIYIVLQKQGIYKDRATAEDKLYYFKLNQLLDILNHYEKLFKKSSSTAKLDQAKLNCIHVLKNVLHSKKECKERANEFFSELERISKLPTMKTHRRALWQRFLADLFSCLLVLPALYRAVQCNNKFNRFSIFKPNSENLLNRLDEVVKEPLGGYRLMVV